MHATDKTFLRGVQESVLRYWDKGHGTRIWGGAYRSWAEFTAYSYINRLNI